MAGMVNVNVGLLSFGGSKRIGNGGGRRRTSWKGRSRTNGSCSYSSMQIQPLADHYRTLRLQPDASEAEVKKAFRKLALQYHPDAYKGGNCKVQFHSINEAYDVVMSNLREEWVENEVPDENEGIRGMFDPDDDLWEEWMGWEGAGIRDYSSHIDPYI